MKHALITGITGQDGSYLAELLLEKGYKVYGLIRRTSVATTARIAHILDRLTILPGDLTDQASLIRAVEVSQPDEVYNLAAMSYVPGSWSSPAATADVTALGVLRMLEAIRMVKPDARFYQASSSEMFGKVRETPQTEYTPFHPRSPYGCAKAYGHYITTNYRESYGLFACAGILFNHESPRRGLEFVTRKITRGAAMIAAGKADSLSLGNLEARRDWGYAGDYVKAMWMMLQQSLPGDYVIATGETNTVGRFADLAFKHFGLDWTEHVRIDPNLYRPAEVDVLLGDPTRAREQLGWKPEVGFEKLVTMMCEAETV